ncbi:MAG TPA: lysoplasmalogenase [Anaerolineales bacterium]|nr:lysoplasmalogenase [Anaerolineales bacterium]
MTYYPVIIVLILAVVDWVAADKKIKPLEYFAKPATMLALLWWMWISVGLGGAMLWFTIGLLFCLAGDVFLMVPRNMFIFGLLAFLFGHVFYILGLNNTPPFINLVGLFLVLILEKPLAIIALVFLVIYIVWLYRKLARGLVTKGIAKLKFPVLIYAIVISLMVYSALMTWYRAGWSPAAALFASIGAVLFFISDSMLAWDRFLNPLNHARLKVMATYHLGQIGIILGAMLSVIGR